MTEKELVQAIKQNKLSHENILDMTLYQMMGYVDENRNIPVDTVDNLYYALLDECFDNPNRDPS